MKNLTKRFQTEMEHLSSRRAVEHAKQKSQVSQWHCVTTQYKPVGQSAVIAGREAVPIISEVLLRPRCLGLKQFLARKSPRESLRIK